MVKTMEFDKKEICEWVLLASPHPVIRDFFFSSRWMALSNARFLSVQRETRLFLELVRRMLSIKNR